MTVAHAFPREHRLTVKRAFDRVFKRGVRSHDASFTVLACRNELTHARLGLAVAKKAAPKATTRNSLKRHIRESFRLAHQALPGADFVVIAKRPAAHLDGAALRTSLDRHWRRLSARCAA
ncbi:MAG: ribonuclease P protein component [Pseudomonadota bacterium]